MKRFPFFLLPLALAASAFGQGPALTFNLLYSSASTCQPASPGTSCVFLPGSVNISTVGITVTGTFSATLQFEASADGGTTWVSINATPMPSGTAVTSTTTSGVWTASAAGLSFVRVRCSAYTSGVATVTLNPSEATAASSGSGAGVTITTVAGLSSVPGKVNGTIAVVTNGASASDCTVGGGSTLVTCQYNGSTWGQITASGSGGGPCTTTALSLQYNNAGAFGCVPDFTFTSPHTLTLGAAGILNINSTTGFTVSQTAGTTTALAITNSTAATSGTAQSSPFDIRTGQFWYNPEFNTGSPPVAAASAADCWSHQVVETNGSNGASYYTLLHNGLSPNCAGTPALAELLAPFTASWGVQTNTLTMPSAPTVVEQGTSGSTDWSYTIAACIGSVCTNTPTPTQITNGNATLTTGNWNKVTWSAVTNADYYEVFRTQAAGTPNTTGDICKIPAGATLECDDKALTADGTGVPGFNATGQVYVGSGPAVGGGNGGGMFGTCGTAPSVSASTASGWYCNNTDNNVHVVNGVTSGTTPNDWGYLTGVVGKTSQKSETGTADGNVLTVTPVALAGTYELHVTISVASGTSCVVGYTATWTDSNGNAQTPTELSLFQNGTAAPALTFTTSAAGNYSAVQMIDVNNAAANIVIKWIGGGTCSAKMTALVQKII